MYLQVSPLHNYAPSTTTFKIRIAPHKDNVQYCWGFVSEDANVYYRRSCQQLNGIYSPIVVWHEYKDMGKGHYRGFAQVYRAPNRLAGESLQNFQILCQIGDRTCS